MTIKLPENQDSLDDLISLYYDLGFISTDPPPEPDDALAHVEMSVDELSEQEEDDGC